MMDLRLQAPDFSFLGIEEVRNSGLPRISVNQDADDQNTIMCSSIKRYGLWSLYEGLNRGKGYVPKSLSAVKLGVGKPKGWVDSFFFVGYIFCLRGVHMARSPITREGYNQLQKELENMKKVVRPQVIKAIEEARAHGDLSENAEYVAAKERQSFVEKKIYEIEQKLANSEIIEACNSPLDRVGFGSVVFLENLDNGGEVTYRVVGPDESDIPAGKISIVSPLGKALLGKEVDDEILVRTPGGVKRYSILKIC